MRRAWCLLLIAPFAVQAEWEDLRAGIEADAVVRAVGQPLIRSRARAGLYETWTYDHGAAVVFVRARVSFWQGPRQRVPEPGNPPADKAGPIPASPPDRRDVRVRHDSRSSRPCAHDPLRSP